MFNEFIFSRDSDFYNKLADKLPVEAKLYPEHYMFMQLIYLNNVENVLHFHGSSKEIQKDEVSFEKLYNHIKPKSFSDCLLLLSLLGYVPNKEIKAIFESAHNNTHFLTEIIHDANGMLLYRHHLEMMLCIFTNTTEEEIVQFRKAWNKKKPSVIKLSKSILINEKESLFDFIIQRNPLKSYPFFISAAYKEAYNLYKSIKYI
jgi:hypothetical protein